MTTQTSAIEYAEQAGIEYCNQLITDLKNWTFDEDTGTAVPCSLFAEHDPIPDGDYSDFCRNYPDADHDAMFRAYIAAFNNCLVEWSEINWPAKKA